MKLRDAVARYRVPPRARSKRYTNGIWEVRGPILAIPELSRFDLGSNWREPRPVSACPQTVRCEPWAVPWQRGLGCLEHTPRRTRNDSERCGFRTMLGQVRDHPGPPRVGSAIFAVQFTTALTSTRSNSVKTARQSEHVSETGPSRPHGIPSTSPCRVWHHHRKANILSMDCVGPL